MTPLARRFSAAYAAFESVAVVLVLPPTVFYGVAFAYAALCGGGAAWFSVSSLMLSTPVVYLGIRLVTGSFDTGAVFDLCFAAFVGVAYGWLHVAVLSGTAFYPSASFAGNVGVLALCVGVPAAVASALVVRGFFLLRRRVSTAARTRFPPLAF
jgi:hypothetical protein